MTWRYVCFILAIALAQWGSAAKAAETAWQAGYEQFREAVLQGDDAKAAEIGDRFIEAAAQDLNHHNPEFGRLALAVGAAHHRAGNFERAADLVGRAQAAFQFAKGYDDRESFDALSLLADIALDAKDFDAALALYQEVITVAVIGDYANDVPGLLTGLAETYDHIDPRIASAIRAAPRYPAIDAGKAP